MWRLSTSRIIAIQHIYWKASNRPFVWPYQQTTLAENALPRRKGGNWTEDPFLATGRTCHCMSLQPKYTTRHMAQLTVLVVAGRQVTTLAQSAGEPNCRTAAVVTFYQSAAVISIIPGHWPPCCCCISVQQHGHQALVGLYKSMLLSRPRPTCQAIQHWLSSDSASLSLPCYISAHADIQLDSTDWQPNRLTCTSSRT